MVARLPKPPRLRVRPYEPTDRDACLAICAGGVPTYFSLGDLEEFRVFLGAPRGTYYVASLAGRRGDTIVACGGFYISADGVAGLTWGMVATDAHGQGLGTQLLRYRLKKIREDRRAWCVRIHTTPVVTAFFRRFGFLQERVIEDSYGPGVHQVTMRLTWREVPEAEPKPPGWTTSS